MNNKEIKRVSKMKRKVTKLVMITSTLERSYHCKEAPSPATAPFDSFPAAAPFDSSPTTAPFDSSPTTTPFDSCPVGVSADSCPAGAP